jgi:hypothetical protein
MTGILALNARISQLKRRSRTRRLFQSNKGTNFRFQWIPAAMNTGQFSLPATKAKGLGP